MPLVKSAIGAIFGALTFPLLAFAQQTSPTPPLGPDFSKIQVTATDLGHHTWMLEGAGGNVTVAAGEDGIIMVDGQFAPMHDKLKAAIAERIPQPIKLSHQHASSRRPHRRQRSFCRRRRDRDRPCQRAAHARRGHHQQRHLREIPPVPPKVCRRNLSDALTVEVKGRSAQLKHPANAHTGGDTYVYFADANVLSTGDIFVNTGRYPNIDYLNGGNIDGMISANDAYLALANDQTKIVPGHGALASKAQLVDFRAMLASARERMQKLVAAARAWTTSKRPSPSPISTRNGRRTSRPRRTSCASCITA